MDKPDIVKWTEEYLGVKLLQYQKEYLRALQTETILFPSLRFGRQLMLYAWLYYQELFKEESL